MLNVLAAIHGTGVTASTTSYESIATVTVGAGGSSSIDFTSIPNTFKHLQIRYIGKTQVSSNYAQQPYIQFNGDTASNYARHFLGAYTGGYSATTAGADTTQTSINLFSGLSSSNYNASMFGAGVIDILDYTSTNKAKTVRQIAGCDGNDNSTLVSTVGLSSGLWYKTPEAITSIKIFASGNLLQYSQFALYGIKG